MTTTPLFPLLLPTRTLRRLTSRLNATQSLDDVHIVTEDIWRAIYRSQPCSEVRFELLKLDQRAYRMCLRLLGQT